MSKKKTEAPNRKPKNTPDGVAPSVPASPVAEPSPPYPPAARAASDELETPTPAPELAGPAAPEPAPAQPAVLPPDWARMGRIEQRMVDANLAELDGYTDAELQQLGGIIADELGLELNPAACVSLGKAGFAFTRAVSAVRKTLK